MQFFGGSSNSLSESTKSKLFNYRYQVFVEQLGWALNTPYGVETDEFDHEETVYVIADDSDQNIIGCARLLPTTFPYLLETVFPELLNGMPPPKSADIWELSRFTSINPNEPSDRKQGQLSAPTTAQLLKEAIRHAKAQGAKRMISVSPIGVERLLRSLGLKSHRAGPPQVIDGHTLIACWIDLENTIF